MKDIRASKVYKNMNAYDACAIAEGFAAETPTADQLQAAWQYIADTGLYHQLQGWYGRVIFNDLIPAGTILPPNQ